MVAKRQTKARPVNADALEEREDGRLGRILAAVALYGATLLLGYIAFATPQPGTAMGAIRDVLCGLGGSFALVLPAFTAWLATLLAMSAAGRKISIWKSCFDGALFLLLLTAAQMFTAETVVKNRMTISGFANFVDKSYSYGRGGGALGAILAWPLYTTLGTWGGFFTTILLALICLTATGRTVRFVRWLNDRTAEMQHDSRQRRMVRENERMFDFDEPRPPRRPSPPRERESMYIPNRDEPAPRPKRAAEPKRTVMAAEKESAPRRSVEEVAESMKKRPAPKKPEETLLDEEARFGTLDGAPAGDGPTMAAFDGSNRRKRGKKADKPDEDQVRMGDDLTIEPEKSDVLENDDPPFDVPKKPMGKLKRPPKIEPEAEEESYNYPPIDLLEAGESVTENHRDSDMQKAELLEETLKQFGITTRLTGIAHGPAVTRFELQPAPGVKVSRITSLSDDIAMHLAAMSVRIEAPIPGKAAVGVEIPNEKVEMVRLRDVLESSEARKSASKIAVGLGKDNSGRYIVADIAKMPHVLIAGQTGSGKSVCINSIITSILFRATPEEVRLILIDPKVVELSIYNDIPHLVCPVVTDCKKAASALDWAVAEMSNRYKRFAERGVRDIKGYNKALKDGEKIMPQMVIVIDELADLMMVAPGEVEDSICRLAQLARAAGMHLVIATQRPSVNVITGVIKANIPTRIAFSVASQVDSRTMIDHGGAEKLLGNGDMLFVPSGINKPMRVQGAWVSDEEVHAITSYIKERSETSYDEDMIEKMDNAARSDAEKEDVSAEYDPRLPEAVEIVVEAGQASVSMLQRRMRVGYARAGRLIDEMEQRGIVSEADGAKPRTVLITREQMNDLFEE